MGSYKDVGDALPFMTTADRTKEIEIVNKIFKELRKTAAKLTCEEFHSMKHSSTQVKDQKS